MGNAAGSAANGGEGGGEEEDVVDLDPFDGVETLGYRVLGVQPKSPAAKAGLVSFLDFIVGANGQMLLGSGEDLQEGDEYDDVDFPALLAENKGKPVELLVWNIKCQEQRLVELTPADDWGGAGLLGVTIRLDNYAAAEERLIRMLEIDNPQSPAAVAGLKSFSDYLLGTTHQTLDSTTILASILQRYRDHVVELYVYNSETDVVRVVALLPTAGWGGPGLLGAQVGTGYLHRFPSAVCRTTGSSVERKVRQVKPERPPKKQQQQLQKQQKQKPTEDAQEGNSSSQPGQDEGNQKQGAKQQLVEPAQHETVLEMEPQLEMEPSEHGDEEEQEQEQEQEQEPYQGNNRNTTNHSTGQETREGGATIAATSTVTTATATAPPAAPADASAAARGEEKASVQQQEQQHQPEVHRASSSSTPQKSIPAAPSSTDKRAAEREAALAAAAALAAPAADGAAAQAVFSGPPPAAAASSNAATGHHSSASAAAASAANGGVPAASSYATTSFMPPPPKMHGATPRS